MIVLLVVVFGCGASLIKDDTNEKRVVYLSVKSEPEGANVYWRIVSSTPGVMNSNRLYLGMTPYMQTKSLNVPGLTEENIKNVSVVLEIEKEGYYDKIEHFSMVGVLNDLEINTKYRLISKSGALSVSKIRSVRNVQPTGLNNNRNQVVRQNKPGAEEEYKKENDYTSLSEALKEPEKVYRLALGGKQLTHLPSEIGKLTNLKVLHLWGNKLKELPSEIGKLTHLEDLVLNRNQLTELSPEIGKLKNLRRLLLSNNQLSQITPEIGKLINLRYLDLCNNLLEKLPKEIGNLEKLSKFTLCSNQLKQVPAEIGNLKSLGHIDLSNNQLSSLPSEMGNLRNLLNLDLSNNRLTELPSEIWALLPNYHIERELVDVIVLTRKPTVPGLYYVDLTVNPLSQEEKERIRNFEKRIKMGRNLMPSFVIIFDK